MTAPERNRRQAAAPPDPLTAMEDLREVAAVLEQLSEPPAAVRRFLVGLRQYEKKAATGVKLEQALGIAPAGSGSRPWHSKSARRRKHLEALVAETPDSLGVTEAAREIADRLNRYATTGWRFERDRSADALPPDPVRRHLHGFLEATGGQVPGERRMLDLVAEARRHLRR